LPIAENDEVGRKLMMLIEGECTETGPLKAAQKFGYTKQRYYQLLALLREQGTAGLCSKPRGPKQNYRRTNDLVQQVIRHRYLDPDASIEVIAQKLVQSGYPISKRSVSRVIEEYGLQKKLHKCRPRGESEKPDFPLEAQRTRSDTQAVRGGFQMAAGLPFIASDKSVLVHVRWR